MDIDVQVLPYRIMAMDEASEFRRRLEDARDAVYRSQAAHDILKKFLLEPEYRHITQYAQERTIPLDDTQSLQSFLGDIISVIDSTETAVCRLAFHPQYQFMEQIKRWFTDNTAETFRTTFVFDPTIVGGFVFEYKGKVYDHSLMRILQEQDALRYTNK